MKSGASPVDVGALDLDVMERDLQQATDHQRSSARVSGIVAPIISIVVILVICELIIRQFRVSPLIMPAPNAVAVEIANNLDILAFHSLVTTVETAVGYLLGILVGIPIALALCFSPLVARLRYPQRTIEYRFEQPHRT